MKRAMTRPETISMAFVSAFGLVLMVAGVAAFASPWLLDGGFVGWLLDVKPSPPGTFVRNPVGAFFEALPAIFSAITGIWLVGFGMPCAVAGGVLGVVGRSRQGGKSRGCGAPTARHRPRTRRTLTAGA